MRNSDERQTTRPHTVDAEPCVDDSRRRMALALFGSLGVGALLHGCDDEGGDRSARIDALGPIVGRDQALNGTTNIQWFDTVESMRAFSVSPSTNFTALVHGYSAPGDGGGGMFVWSTVAATDDAFAGTLNSGLVINALVGGVINANAAPGWRRVAPGPVDVRWFGAKGNRVGNGSSTDPANANYQGDDATNAFKSWAGSIQRRGGGFATIPAGNYRVVCPAGGALCDFTFLTGLSVEAHGAAIYDVGAYAVGAQSQLFRLTACRNVHIAGPKVASLSMFGAGYSSMTGITAVLLLQGCQQIAIECETVGCASAVTATRTPSDPPSYKSAGITVRAKCEQTHYPYASQHSGDRADVTLDCDSCGRDFYLYGVKGVSITLRTKNQQVTAQIAAYSGAGCEDVNVSIVDDESTVRVAAAPQLQLTFGDSSPATLRNIDIQLNVKNPIASPRSHTIGINKFADGNGTADHVGRGHRIEGLTVRGFSDNTGVVVNHLNIDAGSWLSPDRIRGFKVQDFTGKGPSNIVVPFGVLDGAVKWTKVVLDYNIYTANYGVGLVAFEECEAANFSVSTTSTEVHDYHRCKVTDGSTQARELYNKRFYETRIGSAPRNAPNTGGASPYVLCAAKDVGPGSLAGPINIFRVSSIGAVILFRVAYHLTANQVDWNPATRDETFGIKTFTASVNGSGIWTQQSPFANEVPERTLGTASALTLSLVPGDAGGACIAAACSNYTGASARGLFKVEMMVASGSAWIERT